MMLCRVMGALILVAMLAGGVAAQDQDPAAAKPDLVVSDDKPKPTVTFARSWDAAVEEARLLNLPLVVHSHGFY